MKKTIFSMLLLAAAAMTTVSCSSDSEQIQEPQNKIKLSFTAAMPQADTSTRTEFGASTGNGFKSMWSAFDEIHVLDGYGNIVGDFASTSNIASEKATFESSMLVDYIEAGIIAYHGNIGSASCEVTTSSDGTTTSTLTGNLVSAQELRAGKFDSNFDVLVSKPVDVGYIFNHSCEVIPLEFARQTGIIELKVKAKQGHEGIKGAKITNIVISTGDDNYDFGGEFEVTNGILTRHNGWSKSPADPIKADLTKYPVKVGEDKSMFICSLPTEITADKSFTITVNAKKTDGSDLKLSKKITGRKITVPAGLITKMTVSFEDPANQKGDEEVDTETDGVNVTSDVINIVPGYEDNLNGAHIKKALGYASDRIAINGAISAKGHFAICKALKSLTTAIELDLTQATYKKSEYKYNDLSGISHTVKVSDVEISKKMFDGCKISTIKLPNAGITTIAYHAFENLTSLQTIIMPANICNWEGEILIGCNNLTTIYWYYDPINGDAYDLNMTAMQGFDTSKVDIHINMYWDYDGTWQPSGNTWFDETWKSVDATLE